MVCTLSINAPFHSIDRRQQVCQWNAHGLSMRHFIPLMDNVSTINRTKSRVDGLKHRMNRAKSRVDATKCRINRVESRIDATFCRINRPNTDQTTALMRQINASTE
jgi:hypothetical protein